MIASSSHLVRRHHVLVTILGLIAPVAIGVVAATSPSTQAATADRVPAQRYITALVNKKVVRKGRKVKISGSVEAPMAPACAAGVTLTLERSTTGAIYKAIRQVTTDGAGGYAVRTKVTKKSRFRISAPSSDACTAAQSPPRTVKIRPAG